MHTVGTVTVAIPSYNYARYLREAVQSAVDQHGVKLDIVIVDNASTDGSLAVAHELAERHQCVRVVSHEDNNGIVSSFNRCIGEVRGEYSVMLCADDRLTPGSLLRSVRFMEANPNVGLVYGPVIDFTTPAEVKSRLLNRRPGTPLIYEGHEWIERRCSVGTNVIRAPEALVRTSTRRRVGEYDHRCPFTFDLHMWLRLAMVSDVGYLPGPPQALYRVHGTNFSTEGYGTPLPDLEQHWVAFASFLDDLEDTVEVQRWRELISHTMARRARWAATRAFVSSSASPRGKEVDDLLAMAQGVTSDASALEQWNWDVQRRMGRRWARLYPPFIVRLAARRARRYVSDRRQVRSGV